MAGSISLDAYRQASGMNDDFRAGVLDADARYIEIGGRLGAFRDPAHAELALFQHTWIFAGASTDRERAVGRVVAQGNARELAVLVPVALPIVLVEIEAAVGAREHEQRDRCVRLLGGVLDLRPDRHDGSRAHVERHATERRLRVERLAALELLAG